MGDIVNLRTARKRALRQQEAERAAQNRLVHGRSKAERALAKARAAKASRELDHHRITTKSDQAIGEG